MYSEDMDDMEYIEAVVDAEYQGQRLDVFLTEYLADYYVVISRSYVQKLIKDGLVTRKGKVVKANEKVKENDIYDVQFKEPAELEAKPENIPIDIVYEDEDIVVVNKARGMVVHPAAGNHSGTLVNALLYHCKDLSDIGGTIRPGIVHRLDKDTTGLMVVAKNNMSHLFLSSEIKERKVTRKYMALVEGQVMENKGLIEAPIGRHKTDRKKMAVDVRNGKEARTYYTVIERYNEFTLLECTLETGRTHQIRVHLSYIGYPVVGDPVYGKKDTRGMPGQLLHAYKLEFVHPRTKKLMSFSSDLPREFNELLNRFDR